NSNGYETDLSEALKTIKSSFPDRQFYSVTIISDGIFNSGGNPLYEAKTFQAPFITLSIGDSIQQKDIVASNVLYNEKRVYKHIDKNKSIYKCVRIQSGRFKRTST